LTNGIEVRVSSPPERLSRLQWQAAGYGTNTQRFGNSDVRTAGFTGSPRYSLTRNLSLVMSAGYSALDVGNEKLNGPDVAAGFEYDPTSSVKVQALGGWRLENPQADVLLRWDPGPRSRLTASYTDSVGVGQNTLADTLADLAYDPKTRQFIDQRTQLAFAPAPSGVDLENGLTRTQYAAVTFSHEFDVTKVSIRSYLARQKPADGSSARNSSGGDVVTDQTSWGVATGIERPLSRSTKLRVGMSYSQTDLNEDSTRRGSGRASDDFEDVIGSVDLSYALTDNVELGLGYRYQQRFAVEDKDSFEEHMVLVEVTRRF
jgi:uncharacterized protein (PEP-CTERM system associated)